MGTRYGRASTRRKPHACTRLTGGANAGRAQGKAARSTGTYSTGQQPEQPRVSTPPPTASDCRCTSARRLLLPPNSTRSTCGHSERGSVGRVLGR